MEDNDDTHSEFKVIYALDNYSELINKRKLTSHKMINSSRLVFMNQRTMDTLKIF